MGISGEAETGAVCAGCPHLQSRARERVQAFWPEAKTLAEGGSIPPEHEKAGAPGGCASGAQPTKLKRM